MSDFLASLTCGWTLWLPWRRQGQGLGGEDLRVERGSRRACAKTCSLKEVLMAWAREWAKEGVKVDWQNLLPPKGFQVLPRRWVVERTFSWIDQNRRMSKDYEKLCASGEAFVYAAMSRLMLRRLTRT
jgi:transposase